ncbi:serine/arginine-rich splicing factor 7-like [Clavelina lepadiformis]|uniref:Uncharacterized protein n=1 Tax=Clavelina lepadiformis TaxID=159417 RepID=A0ABP0GY46_CLALP
MSYRGTKLYVGNLSSTTTRSDLEYEFGYYGRILNVWVAKNPPGFSYVEFQDSRDADDAIKGLDGRELHGRRIRVERSHSMPRSRRDDVGSGRFGNYRRPFHPSDKCYNCGESGHYAYDCDLYGRRTRGRRSHSRSRSRTPQRKKRCTRSRSYSKSPRRRSPSRSRSRSYSRSRSRSRSNSRENGRRSRTTSRSPRKPRSQRSNDERNGRSLSRSRSRS